MEVEMRAEKIGWAGCGEIFKNWNTYRSMLLRNMNEKKTDTISAGLTVRFAKYRLNLNPG